MGKLRSTYFTFSKDTFTSKYFLITLAFVAWMVFFDNNGLSTNIKLGNAIERLENSKIEYEEKIVEALAQKKELEENKEKYAREKFLMHKENEDVIIIQKRKK